MPLTPDAPDTPRPRLLLVGAGHAHLHLIRHRQRFGDAEVCLVDPGGFWYSAMAGGVLSGRLPASADRLDPARLARRHGVTPIRGRLASLDLAGKQALLEDGRHLPFTLLSLNVGSRTPSPVARQPGPAVWTVKPLPCLVALHHRLTRDFRAGQCPSLVVVGGGASGIEVASNLHALARRHRVACAITLVTRGTSLIPDAPAGARRFLARLMARRGIRVITGAEVTGTLGRGVMLRTDETRSGEDSLSLVEADHVIHAGGLAPPAVLEHLGLPLFPDRGLAVSATLQSLGHPDIFAAGDCAAMRDHRLPRLGVYGVRQAPVLLDNLIARLAGRELRHFEPQPRALAILDLGEGLGLAIRGRHWWAGRSALLWKGWLDRRFMAQYR
ncbi:NAD(P)/FAD-dependent oxidoreductase [Halomonas campaniensis]|jgi:NADH dehydrogenase FAD-containing subunit|uniref:NAD(P)/FAD-dependent oxidoreductase n=1 Tax=Halomonas campaniensis TaxID=213554 RepID=UPI003970EEBB